MKIPEGKLIAEAVKPVPEALKDYGHDFRGCIHIRQGEDGRASEGFILIEDGNVLASAFMTLGITLYQMNALDRIMMLREPSLKVYAYSDEDKTQIFRDYPDSVIGDLPPDVEPQPDAADETPAGPEDKRIPYDVLLATVIQLPGVIAAALVVDGLPIYQQGQNTDFEHIAVATEDMVRSGTKIATELQLGSAEQIILESPSNKVIIAPINDMFLCVLTSSDTNLGLVRLSIRNAQNNMRDQ
ncbi:MAG TPA: roadblock/LC7 domain-containing protein [Methanocella sp.]|uniref:roadblock/LC7 domain-containing protein n=1 Tax=Methanocella sp. TaxID=2052833 RepID=UPI002B544504|nr:roadblock/LC7 domain-containing protein [Methanocella sp.]HTY91963.1 roadblock/LC7 domain-containing protein [Methanocella sp.]